MKLKGKYLKYLLYVYTIIIVAFTVFTALSIVKIPERTVEAACNDSRFDNTSQCVASCQWGCKQPGATSDVIACINGCGFECKRLCGTEDSGSDPTPNPQSSCVVDDNGQTFTLTGGACGNVSIRRCYTSYDGINNKCPTNDNCVFIENAIENKSYSANPAPGECVQVDYSYADNNMGGGGVCSCNPPVVNPEPVKCNDICNSSDKLCENGLSCINIDGANRCRLQGNPGSQTCQPPIQQNPSYTIDKYIDSGKVNYNIGDLVTYKVRITNTGNTSFTNLKFRDVYNANYLTYVGGSAIKSSGGSISDINPKLTKKTSGTIEIENITSSEVIGTLPEGAYIEVTVKFIAKAPIDETCNYAYAKIPELSEINDNACIGSHNIDTDL